MSAPRAGEGPGDVPTDDVSDRVLDRESLLVSVSGSTRLGALERALVEDGYTLGLGPDAPLELSIDAWIAGGAVGARDPFRDPVDHLVAGFEGALLGTNAGTETNAVTNTTARLALRPMPRRAAGPDPWALFFGAGSRFARLTRVWLRIHLPNATRVESSAFDRPVDPPVSDDESTLWDAIARALEG